MERRAKFYQLELRKVCSHCKKEQSFIEFHRKPDTKYGRMLKCRTCSYQYKKDNPDKVKKHRITNVSNRTPERKAELIEYQKIYREKNKEIIAKKTKAYREKNKKWFIEYEKFRRDKTKKREQRRKYFPKKCNLRWMKEKGLIKDILVFQINRHLILQAKFFLELMEDTGIQGDTHARIRKKVLDKANDSVREIEALFDKIDF